MKNKLFEKMLPLYGLELRDNQVTKLLNVSIATLYRMRVNKEIKYKKYIIQTTRSDRIIYLHLKIFRHLDFSSEIAIFVLSCKEIRRPRRRTGRRAQDRAK